MMSENYLQELLEHEDNELSGGFGLDRDDDLTYAEAWDEVEQFLEDEHYVTEYWQHRAIAEYEGFYSGAVNGVMWVAQYYDDEEAWSFEFMTYETYEEYY